MRKLLRRVLYITNRRRHEAQLAEEMAAHRGQLADDRGTMFGSPLRLREESRDVWGFCWLDQLWQDLSYGVRTLRRSPGFTLMAVLVLSLGVGVNLSMYQAVDALFFARIAVEDSSLLQRVFRQSPERNQFALPTALADFLRENASQFQYLVTERTAPLAVTFEQNQRKAGAQFVSPNYFTAQRVSPLAGRLPEPADSAASAAPVAAISYGFWQRQYGGDPAVLNRLVLLNAKPVRIIGITQQEFGGLSGDGADLWIPATQRTLLVEEAGPLEASLRSDTGLVGVLKPGVTPAAAAEQIQSLTNQWRAGQPAQALEDDEAMRVRPLGENDRKMGSFYLMPFLTMLVLLASCANLGNMLLARGLTRGREIATRIAVGAGRWRVLRQLMTENLILAALGTIGGLFAARIGGPLFLLMFQASPNIRIQTNWRLIVVACTLALFSALLFGLAPALSALRRGHRPNRARRVLLAVQVATSCVLVISASLIARGGNRLLESGSHLKFEEIVIVDAQIEEVRLAPAAARQTLQDLGRKIAALPGVRGVTFARGMPLFGARVENAPGIPTTFWQSVDPTYFALMGLPLTRGRNFERGEPQDNVIISESAARFRWPGEDPLTKSWTYEGAPRRVIGVVADTDGTAFRNPNAIEAYTLLPDRVAANSLLIVRTNGDPAPQLENIRTAATLPGQTPYVRLLQDYVDGWIAHAGQATGMLAGLGSIASFLAAVGIFGMVAYAVAERTGEIGVRVALGAKAHNILHTLFASYTLPLTLGAGAGVAVTYVLVRIMKAQIILGMVDFDVPGYLIGLGVFAAIVLAAVVLPVRRALRIDPASALRWE